jgi:predicted transcriptional regulator
MAIGIVSNDDFERELEQLGIKKVNGNEKSETDLAKILDINRGRGTGSLEVPDSLRKVIGEEALVNGNSSANGLAEELGISKSSVSAYKNGSTSTKSYNEPDKNLKEHTDAIRNKISSRARLKLLMAMGTVTKDKLENAKLRDVAAVANAMSNIIKNLEPAVSETGNQTNFIFYAPKPKEESQFEVINLKE